MKRQVLIGLALLASCTGETPATAPGGAMSGGTIAAGGSGGGGSTGTGGASAAGGSVATGGDGAGGAPGAGAAPGTGGRSDGAGTGGTTGTGGSASGGGRGTGGDRGTGGNATGGTAGTTAADAGSDRDLASDPRPDGPAADLQTAKDLAAERPTATISVYIAGDSTVSTYTGSSIKQAGWGQFLQNYVDGKAKVVNKAVGGMTARHFIEAGYLDQILSAIKAGDYLLVQFGTNDGNKTATYTLPGSSTAIPYYLDPQTDFKTYLKKYVDGTRAKGATTLFVTPPPRHTCDPGELGVRNGLSAYATAMNELGPTLDTPVVELNAMTMAYLANVTCETSGKTFYLVKADGSIDGTHFQENGADVMAGLVAKGTTGIRTLGLPLSAYVK